MVRAWRLTATSLMRTSGALIAAGLLALATPASAVTVNVDDSITSSPGDGFFSPGDDVFYNASGIVDSSGIVLGFGFSFKLASNGSISVVNGLENTSSQRVDMFLQSVQLSGGPATGAAILGGNTHGSKFVDKFDATWSNLIANTWYTLTVFYKAVGGVGLGATTFGGQLSISAVPVPPAAVLFGSAIVGMGLLMRRRKQKSALA